MPGTKPLDERTDDTKGGVAYRLANFNNQKDALRDCSELEREGELDRARAADLVQRFEAAALSATS